MNEMISNDFSGVGSVDTQSNAHLETFNIVLVGDTGVGKTNLLLSYATD